MMKPGKQEILAVKKVKNIIVRIMRMGRGKLMAAFVTKFARKVKLCLTDNSSNFYPFSSAIHSSLLFELYTSYPTSQFTSTKTNIIKNLAVLDCSITER